MEERRREEKKKAPLKSPYDLWYYSVPSDRIGPFRNLKAGDLSTCKVGGVYLSSGRALVKVIEHKKLLS